MADKAGNLGGDSRLNTLMYLYGTVSCMKREITQS